MARPSHLREFCVLVMAEVGAGSRDGNGGGDKIKVSSKALAKMGVTVVS